ncbi:uncharacterized protein L3040_008257 [Drepanopeziza brunnea f. sp. 'multigermtubi']|uniref:uncharacterized protein n=1 Tax=Drepanopeziza brunnea f. sp. 'multigermtubi' TaxID=698441 RepID=UPI0023A5D1B4|nr:hypothetical protein L3040_008257 [Drepanopeziza brunnea f. sp. 'multigermtubi']
MTWEWGKIQPCVWTRTVTGQALLEGSHVRDVLASFPVIHPAPVECSSGKSGKMNLPTICFTILWHSAYTEHFSSPVASAMKR